ncbi:MAG: cobaltochelatase subunit CobN, partial [Methanospirillum sp.]|uniref:cobaltochelatase subunit CobN n=1 Tax=Methanospirillum sp. TaxID=45200 RepID=UPI00236D5A13
FSAYFSTLSNTVQEKITATWGEAPGMSMVLDGTILITGLSFGNSTVHVQPKRGCYGSRCDGQVCKILHDPECPPPHQYLATYFWIEKIFNADLIVNVGTHGNLEFLPGKGLGLSEDCFPDVAIGTTPHLYIYNADNPPEGTIAKRRGYATLIDHMQAVMTQGGLYEGLDELDVLVSQYETAKLDPARSHSLQHLIRDAIIDLNLDKDIHLTEEMALDEIVSRSHEILSKIRNTQIPSEMHTFGELPEGEKRLDFINAIIRYDSGDPSPRRTIARLHGHNLTELLQNQDGFSDTLGLSTGAILEDLEDKTKQFIASVLDDTLESYQTWFGHAVSPQDVDELDRICSRIIDINKRINDSKEIESLCNGFSGGHIPAGPSGLISRGHEEVLPTGRNFYSLDPYKVPTKAAWRVGQRLADSLIEKYISEESRLPESVAFFWMSGDILAADGEVFSQLLSLLGVEPVWESNGKVSTFTIIPLDKLGRPRIDITVRASGLIRDNLSNCYELVDRAVQAVASLDEPIEMNYVRKHALESMEQNNSSWQESTLRIFSSKPGSYYNGVDLAVLASAWKDETDLAELYVAWNGYALRRGCEGKEAHGQFALNLSKVSVTYNKVHSDETDLLGCCCYFGTHGGMTAAARHYSGKEVKPYYGDTREPEHIEVRDLSDELRRVVRAKLLNPRWIEGMKKHGYKGAGDIMRRVTHIYGWEASTEEVDDWIFDDIAETFVNDDEMRQFFEENNPYALEEIARRLLEAEQRGLWNADQDVLESLKNNYLQIESWMEEKIGEGDYQGGSVDIYTRNDVEIWGNSIKEIMANVQEKFSERS